MKPYLLAAATASLLLTLGASASFAQLTKIAGGTEADNANNVVSNGSTIVISSTDYLASGTVVGQTNASTSFMVSALGLNSSATPNGNGGFSEVLTPLAPTSFILGTTADPLLEGTFTTAKLNSSDPSSGFIQLTGVSYTGGSYFPVGFNGSATNPYNVISFTFNAPGTITETNGVVSSFSAIDSFTADSSPNTVTSTPEPASVATFGIGSLALLGMGLAAKRRKQSLSL